MVLDPTALTEALLSVDGYKIVTVGVEGTYLRDVLFSYDDDITLNLMFLLFYGDKSYTVKLTVTWFIS